MTTLEAPFWVIYSVLCARGVLVRESTTNHREWNKKKQQQQNFTHNEREKARELTKNRKKSVVS